jgi:predicted permease
MDTLRLDLAYALRWWRRQPGTTAAAIVALALGIGANTTVFSFVSAVLLQPLPYPDPSRLVMVWQDRSANGGRAREVISPGLFVDWSTRATLLRDVAAIRGWAPNLTGADASGNGEPERLTGATITGAYFSALGVAAAYGRTLAADDDRPGTATRVVLSHRLWQRRFGAQPSIVGRMIQLDGQAAEIVGVMPASFQPAVISDAEIWNAARIDAASAPRGIVILRTLARLAPDATLEQAQAAMSTLQTQLQQDDPELEGARVRLVPLHDDIVGPARPVLVVLSGSVLMVLLIACANVASLLMARASQRRSEMAMRVALGAGRGRLIQQLLVESGLLAGAASALGLAFAWFGVRALIAAAPAQSPRLDEVRIDVAVLAFNLVVTAVAAVMAGLVPALMASRSRGPAGIRDTGRETRALARTRALIVTFEVAGAMMLVAGAGLFVRSLIGLQSVDLGFQPARLLTASVSPPRGAYRDTAATSALFDRILARASQLPGVQAASMTSVLPLSGMQINFSFGIEGRPRGRTIDDEPVASFRSVDRNFFSTMGMRVLHGRGFTSDDRTQAPSVAVVNEALVKRYWNGVAPIGARISINGDPATIVGVVADVHHFGPRAVPEGEMYAPYVQRGARGGWLVVRTTGDPAALATGLRAIMPDVDPNLPLANIRTMSSMVAASVAEPRFLATLLSGFSAVSVVLAVMGVYTLLAFSVSQRVKEIGVRMALGASRARVVRLVLKESLAIVIAGVIAGAVAAAALSRVARSLLFGIEPGDPATLAGMGALIVTASLVASYLPARRAAAIGPSAALREE